MFRNWCSFDRELLSAVKCLLDFTNLLRLSQLVEEATYISDNVRSQLDVFITGSPGYCNDCITLPQIGTCHHLPVLADNHYEFVMKNLINGVFMISVRLIGII